MFPTLAYCSILWLLGYSIWNRRVNYIVGLVLLILPMVSVRVYLSINNPFIIAY